MHQQTGHSIRRICKILNVSRSSYYHADKPTARQLESQELRKTIVEIFNRHRRRYGYRRIQSELSDRKIKCSASRVRKIMINNNLKAIQPKSYVPKTSDGRADKPSDNLLLGKHIPDQPNKVWAGDFTYIPTSKGWRYLSVIIDLFSRRIVAWELSDTMCAELATAPLLRALRSRQVPSGLIFHSDRGSQYGSQAFRKILHVARIQQSMSARANPYHNAWTESWMGILKREMLQDGIFDTELDAKIEISHYINSYYNHHRKHSSLGYQTPSQFEAKYHLQTT